jgi:CRP-like cAMP-binding protein
MAVHPSLLHQFRLLTHLSDTRCRQLAGASSLVSFARREVVVEKNAPLTSFGFLHEGRLQLVDFTLDGKEVGLYFVEEGEFYGEVSMLDGLAQPEFVIASRKSQVVQVPASMLRAFVIEEPRIAEAILLGLARKLRHQSAQRQILSITNPLQRVCAQILLLVEHFAAYSGFASAGQPLEPCNQRTSSKNEPTRTLAIAPTHQELAMMVNLSRETVTRVFQVLQSRNLIDRQGDALVVSVREVEAMAQNGE